MLDAIFLVAGLAFFAAAMPVRGCDERRLYCLSASGGLQDKACDDVGLR